MRACDRSVNAVTTTAPVRMAAAVAINGAHQGCSALTGIPLAHQPTMWREAFTLAAVRARSHQDISKNRVHTALPFSRV
ncbi:hypothetical protein MYIN104542_00355 [Mycobacterium intermedium]